MFHTPFECENGVQIAFDVPIYTSWLKPGCVCYWGSMVLVEIEIECVEKVSPQNSCGIASSNLNPVSFNLYNSIDS